MLQGHVHLVQQLAPVLECGDAAVEQLIPVLQQAVVSGLDRIQVAGGVTVCRDRHDSEGARVSHLAAGLFQQLKGRDGGFAGMPRVDEVRDVVLASIQPAAVDLDDDRQRVEVLVKANYVEVAGGAARELYAEERWIFDRPPGVASPTPEAASTLGCHFLWYRIPSCVVHDGA